MIVYNQEDIDRFYSKITVIEEGENTDCWEIDLYKDRDGYSRICVKDKIFICHRFMYQIWHPEEDINGKLIRHSCDNPGCVNPKYLTSGSHQDNTNDKVSKNRQLKGEKIPQSILTEENIDEIINNTLSGYFISCKEIADYYKVSDETIRRLIIHEKCWKHVTKNYDMIKIRSLLLKENQKGCNRYSSSLLEDNIRDIRQRLKTGESQRSIAKFYDISQGTISRIKLGKTYQDVIEK